ncbi:MAG: hypothetical protein IPL45_04800 [Actinomycetales bacterium]|nr:hypothetical protein [Actinomycetales bacterium]
MIVPPRALVLAVHGTLSEAGQAISAHLRHDVARRLPEVQVVLGWADVLQPPLVETLAAVGDCVVVPVFLTAGYHVSHDLPDAVRDSGGRAVITAHIGDSILAAVAERLVDVDPEPDAVVLAAAGSRYPGSLAEVRSAARQLAQLLARPVSAAFVSGAEPTVADAVAAVRARGAVRVSVASYFLAPGMLTARLTGAGADVVASPVGSHPVLVAAVVERYLDATGADRSAQR